MNDKGPVIDWMREVLTQIWRTLTDLVHWLSTIGDRLEARVDRLETKAAWAIGIVLVVMLIHGWWTRPRKD